MKNENEEELMKGIYLFWKEYLEEKKRIRRKKFFNKILRAVLSISLYSVAWVLIDKGFALSLAIMSLFLLASIIGRGE